MKIVFVHMFVHDTKEINNLLLISFIQRNLHSLIIRGSLVQAQVGPHNKSVNSLTNNELTDFSFVNSHN